MDSSSITRLARPAIRTDSAARRATDVVVAGAALLFVLPLFALIAVLVRLGGRGPVFFLQERAGRGGRPFRILKFRTMVVGAERMGAAVSGRRDPRVTRVGGVLRATKLDELPQLLNVLAGEMTLIGPRPEVIRYVAHYTPAERAVLDARPGITGPNQVDVATDEAGILDAAEDPETHYIEHLLHPKLALDLDYLRQRSLAADLAIVGRTLALLLGLRRPRTPGRLSATALRWR